MQQRDMLRFQEEERLKEEEAQRAAAEEEAKRKEEEELRQLEIKRQQVVTEIKTFLTSC